MSYVVIEFVGDNAPQLVEDDLAMEHIALCLCLPLSDLTKQSGPALSSTSVWNARTEEMIAVYRPMRSLREFL